MARFYLVSSAGGVDVSEYQIVFIAILVIRGVFGLFSDATKIGIWLKKQMQKMVDG